MCCQQKSIPQLFLDCSVDVNKVRLVSSPACCVCVDDLDDLWMIAQRGVIKYPYCYCSQSPPFGLLVVLVYI